MLAIQGVLAGVLYLAALLKFLAGPAITVAALRSAGWGDVERATVLARILPWAEVALACWLVSGRFPTAAACAALGLLVAFSSMLVLIGRATGWSRPCGCFGALDKTTIASGLVRNALLIVASMVLVLLVRRNAARKATQFGVGRRTAASTGAPGPWAGLC